MRALPLAVGSDFCLHDYLMQRAPKGRDESGHGSEGWAEKEGDHCENEEPLGRSKKR